jgi:hypothetical protein
VSQKVSVFAAGFCNGVDFWKTLQSLLYMCSQLSQYLKADKGFLRVNICRLRPKSGKNTHDGYYAFSHRKPFLLLAF